MGRGDYWCCLPPNATASLLLVTTIQSFKEKKYKKNNKKIPAVCLTSNELAGATIIPPFLSFSHLLSLSLSLPLPLSFTLGSYLYGT